jgi:protein-S-isoprenylcysteine O-methyltransferase Ste14
MRLSRIGIALIVIGVIAFAVITFMDRVLHWGNPWVLEIACLVLALIGWAVLYVGKAQERKQAKEQAVRQLESQRKSQDN